MDRLNTRVAYAPADIARYATAVVIGKNNANAGIKRVPSPKPENNVIVETTSATRPITRYAMTPVDPTPPVLRLESGTGYNAPDRRATPLQSVPTLQP